MDRRRAIGQRDPAVPNAIPSVNAIYGSYRTSPVSDVCDWHRRVNSLTASFFSSRKKERIRKRIYKIREVVRADIFDYIEVLSNHARYYGHPGGISPESFGLASSWGQDMSALVEAAQQSIVQQHIKWKAFSIVQNNTVKSGRQPVMSEVQ